jgi:hypothetical protein
LSGERLAVFRRFAKFFLMSTVAEIEAAIEHLPASELRRLREKFFSRPIAAPVVKPKTGAELAEIFPRRFHLRPAEADALAAEMSSARKFPPQPSAWE